VNADRLLEMQRQLLAALREPLTGDGRARTELPPRAEPPSPAFVAAAATWLTPSALLAPAERLGVYHRQYWYRLLDSLVEDFPAVRAVLGPPRFAQLIERYLAAHPPTTFTLRDAGAHLPAFVAAHPADLPHAAHVVDLARLEVAWIAAFEAAERPPAPADALASIPLGLQPHLTLLALRTPADTIWRRVVADEPPGRLRPAGPARHLAVFRDGLARQVERLHPAAHALLAAIADGAALDAALDAAAPLLPARRGAALVRAWFETWAERRWLVPAGPRDATP
jgi:hypothetical protein